MKTPKLFKQVRRQLERQCVQDERSQTLENLVYLLKKWAPRDVERQKKFLRISFRKVLESLNSREKIYFRTHGLV